MLEFEKLQFSKGIYNAYDDIYPAYGVFPELPSGIEVLLAARRRGVPDPLNDKETKLKLDQISQNDVRNDINREMMRRSFLQQYALNVSGGSGNYNYYGSAGYDRELPTGIRSVDDRFTVSFGNNYKILKKVELGAQLVHSRRTGVTRGISYNDLLNPSAKVSPYARLIDDEGTYLPITKGYRMPYIDTAAVSEAGDWYFRPLQEFEHQNVRSNTNETRINLALKYSVASWLKFDLQYQNELNYRNIVNTYDASSYVVRDGINKSMYYDQNGILVYPWPMGDLLDKYNEIEKAWNIRGSVGIDKQWKNSRVSGILGVERREASLEGSSDMIYGFDPNTYISQQVDPTKVIVTRPDRGSLMLGQVANPVGRLNRFGSMFTNFAYSWNDRYVLTVGGRIDQSNNFGIKSNLRQVPLWSVGGRWQINEEKWFSLDWLDILALKLSYGYTGNTITNATSSATFKYEDTEYYLPPRLNFRYGSILSPSNPGLRWERVKIVNFGGEVSMFNGKLNSTIEYYLKRGLDLVGQIKSDPTTGFGSFVGNNASMKSSGLDLTINTNLNITKDLSWKSSLLFSFNKNKILDYYLPRPASGEYLAMGWVAINPGDPINPVYSFRSAGLDGNSGDPLVILGDTISNYSNISDAKISDLKYHGSVSPRYFGSFLNEFRLGNLALSCLITYRWGHFLGLLQLTIVSC